MKPFIWGSVDHQYNLFKSLGLNPEDYNPEDDQKVSHFSTAAINALLSGKDASGKRLSIDDLELLSTLTGR